MMKKLLSLILLFTLTFNPVFAIGSKVSGNLQVTGTATIGTTSGILKRTAGVVSNATAGTDYLAPSSDYAWNYTRLQLISNGTWSATTNYTYDLSSVLTDATVTYECIFQIASISSSAGSGNVYVNFTVSETPVYCNVATAPASATLMIPIANRTVQLKNYGSQQNNAYFGLLAFRKVR